VNVFDSRQERELFYLRLAHQLGFNEIQAKTLLDIIEREGGLQRTLRRSV